MYDLMDTPEWKALQVEREKLYAEQQRQPKIDRMELLSDLDLALMKDRLETHERVENDDNCWPTEGPISSGAEKYYCQEVCSLDFLGRKSKNCWEACDLVDRRLLAPTPGFEDFYEEKEKVNRLDAIKHAAQRTKEYLFSLASKWRIAPPT